MARGLLVSASAAWLCGRHRNQGLSQAEELGCGRANT